MAELKDSHFRNAKPKEKDYTISDGHGLMMLVRANGSKLWQMRVYRNKGEIKLSFGEYPAVSLSDARKKRDYVRSLVAQGIDPREVLNEEKVKQAEQRKTDKTRTFQYLAGGLYESKQGHTQDEYRNRMLRQLEIHVFPAIGQSDIDENNGKTLLELFTSIAGKLNKKGEPMTYMAKKLCSWSAEVVDYARAIGVRKTAGNPFRDIIKLLPKHETKNSKQIPQKLLKDFVQALDAYGGYILTKNAIWMMLYTGFRQISIRNAQWSDFDLDNAIWRRKPEKTDKNIHEIPLPWQAVQMLKEQKQMLEPASDSDYVFPSVFDEKSRMSEASIGQAIKKMGFDAVGHGLRGTVTTGLNEKGFFSDLVEKQVGHKTGNSVERAYNKSKLFNQRKDMMQEWADYLDELRGLPGTGNVHP